MERPAISEKATDLFYASRKNCKDDVDIIGFWIGSGYNGWIRAGCPGSGGWIGGGRGLRYEFTRGEKSQGDYECDDKITD